MQIFVEGNAVRYIDGDINLSTAKGNITQIKISNTKIAFKSRKLC